MMPEETIKSGGPATCKECKGPVGLRIRVHKRGAGFYIGAR